MKLSAKIISGVAIVAAIVTLIATFVKLHKIPPGYVGVSVRKCGDSGVSKAPIPTGYYWRTLFCEEVITYPVSMQALILTNNPHEGTGGPDGVEEAQALTVTSSEGLGIEVDVSFNFTLAPQLVPKIYETWRTDIERIQHTYLRQTIREIVQLTFAKYSAEELYAVKKEIARAEVEKFLVDRLSPMGFIPSQFTINRIEPPKAVIEAINSKVAMIQQAQRSEQEVRKVQAEAAQAVAVAKGEADAVRARAEGEAASITVRAEAQAKANKILAESLTPGLVEYEKARRWNGILPTTTGGVVPMLQVK